MCCFNWPREALFCHILLDHNHLLQLLPPLYILQSMPVPPRGCRSCRLEDYAPHPEKDKDLLKVLYESSNLRDVAREVVALRATHNCQVEEDFAELKEKYEHALSKIGELEDELASLDISEILPRIAALEKHNRHLTIDLNSANASRDRLKRRVRVLERELEFQEQAFDVRFPSFFMIQCHALNGEAE